MKQKNLTQINEKNRRRYDEAFKKDTLRLVQNGRSVNEVAKSLGISDQLLYNWKSKIRNKVLKKGTSEEQGVYAEKEALCKQLRQAEMKRDILKKLWPYSVNPNRGEIRYGNEIGKRVSREKSLPGPGSKYEWLL
ncbi:MAG: transposase [Saprospiraceae bacterium]|nr:transposase [Saprospiraceae bacterium]